MYFILIYINSVSTARLLADPNASAASTKTAARGGRPEERGWVRRKCAGVVAQQRIGDLGQNEFNSALLRVFWLFFYHPPCTLFHTTPFPTHTKNFLRGPGKRQTSFPAWHSCISPCTRLYITGPRIALTPSPTVEQPLDGTMVNVYSHDGLYIVYIQLSRFVYVLIQMVSSL